MHGPAEVAFASELFGRVEKLLGLPGQHREAGHHGRGAPHQRQPQGLHRRRVLRRVAFINTGFLDRTGDEMHTAMLAGPMLRKGDMKASAWIQAYERNNVLVGLSCGLRGKAQIGKGMWAMPDLMAAMLEQKIGHPRPAPTPPGCRARRRHAARAALPPGRRVQGAEGAGEGRRTPSARLLVRPADHAGGEEGRTGATSEAAGAGQQRPGHPGLRGALGRPGRGLPKVPDIHNVGLMEDRATLRISSQHIANWLQHGVVSEGQVRATFERMAEVVDQQNAGDPLSPAHGRPPDTSRAYRAALISSSGQGTAQRLHRAAAACGPSVVKTATAQTTAAAA